MKRIADSTVRRLSIYLRFLEESENRGLTTISSQELARRGMARAEWEGPLAFAQRVERERPDLAALTSEAAACYVELRYGCQGDDRLAQLQQCLRRLPPQRRRKA